MRYFKDKRFIAFGKRVSELRQNQGLEPRDIAARTTLSVRDLNAIEDGEKNFGFTTLFELAKGLSMTPSELLDIDFEE